MKYEIVKDTNGFYLRSEDGHDRHLPSPKFAEELKDRVGEMLTFNVDFELEYFHNDYAFAVPKGSAYKNI